jgi:hypothetical protein
VRTLPGRYLLVAVPALVVPTTPQTATRQGESMAFRLGGTRADTTRGSVWVESKDGVTRQFRDEWAALVPVTVSSDRVAGIVIVADDRSSRDSGAGAVKPPRDCDLHVDIVLSAK